jgi:hypothetical protein
MYKPSKVPGPGTYNDLYNPETQLSYTMRQRTQKPANFWNVIPLILKKTGPGYYNPKEDYLSTGSQKISYQMMK